ncbi:MAG: sensor histidine kinase, partial [Halobacteriaceae archaeon]
DALEAHKQEQAPIFCPVVLIRREQTPITVDLPAPGTGDRPVLVNEVLSAPVDQQVLFRRIANLRARRQQTVTLQEQTERMEQFASTVRHEFRNSLTVLDGWLDAARERGETEAFEQCQFAIDQMQRMVEETALLLDNGEHELNCDVVDVAAACEASWEAVPADTASLELTATQRIVADEDRLAQLLNNLFRNAVEHGGEEVTITVGDLADGFYVEDDGPGIPDDEREAVFEEGYSTRDSGSGLGLAVVRKVASLHDWEIQVTDSGTGGARFEITDCEIVEQEQVSEEIEGATE